ncbi:MAG: hypothetical protein IJA52_08780 [Clostridia bacterium]|nr:hypothetical protein [Clostridia bacterium]
MDYVENMLEIIKNDYGVLIGKKSISELATFICAYELGVHDATGVECRFNREFQGFVEEKHNLKHTSKHWTEIISEGKGPEEAFDFFFDYWNEFKTTRA